jgi:ElaB/YqjD/DUF883 family membrane-anchored ribosome-binding protein
MTTEQLRRNIQDQLNRLVSQLEDLENEKGSLEVEEYEEMRGETLEEMKVFEKQMEMMLSGDTTLVTEFQAAKLVCYTVQPLFTIGVARSSFQSVPNARGNSYVCKQEQRAIEAEIRPIATRCDIGQTC